MCLNFDISMLFTAKLLQRFDHQDMCFFYVSGNGLTASIAASWIEVWSPSILPDKSENKPVSEEASSVTRKDDLRWWMKPMSYLLQETKRSY